MNKQVFIINGTGGSGKDTFVSIVKEQLKDIIDDSDVLNYSSVTKVKQIATHCGWHGGKSEKDRKFLSDLKLLLTDYNNLPLEDMKKEYRYFMLPHVYPYENSLLFFHIREPEEIDKAVKEFNATTVLVKRNSVKHIISNVADANVYNYDYDIVIKNNGTLEGLEEKAAQFVNDYINGELKKTY